MELVRGCMFMATNYFGKWFSTLLFVPSRFHECRASPPSALTIPCSFSSFIFQRFNAYWMGQYTSRSLSSSTVLSFSDLSSLIQKFRRNVQDQHFCSSWMRSFHGLPFVMSIDPIAHSHTPQHSSIIDHALLLSYFGQNDALPSTRRIQIFDFEYPTNSGTCFPRTGFSLPTPQVLTLSSPCMLRNQFICPTFQFSPLAPFFIYSTLF
jgi:hypothetical protein